MKNVNNFSHLNSLLTSNVHYSKIYDTHGITRDRYTKYMYLVIIIRDITK